MKTFLVATLGAFAGAILGTVIIGITGAGLIGSLINAATAPPAQPQSMVLTLDMRDALDDQAPTTGLEALLGNPVGFIDVITRLDAAARDDRVKGVLIRTSEFGIGSARSEEYRTALMTLRANGKFVLAHSQGIYSGISAYRAISVADEVWVQPGSEIIATGVGFETLFLRGLFDKLSIEPDFVSLYEFKNAPNTYQETEFTAPHRLAMTALAESIWSNSLQSIAEDRRMRTDALTPILESGPLDVEQLMETGLADAIGWPHDAEAAAIQRAGKGSKTLDILSYVPPSPAAKAPAIAIVGGEGPIMTGSADGSLFAEGRGFASDTVAEALYAAGKDPEVEAIVFRVNSPGGSATASDQIWRAVQEVREAFDKPVVVSMADYAASGGYYVSAGADWIVANPSTITGSIGIFGGKFGISGALDEIGINAEAIEVGGSFTGAFTTTEPFTEGQREAITQWLQRGYDRFVSLVADGRGLAVEEVDARARGRVWSGQHALEQGLVDELGGIMTAIAKARSLANIPESSEVRYLTYPQSEAGFSIGPQQMSAGSLGQFGSLVTLLELLNQPEVQQAITGVSNPSRLQLESRTPVYVEH